MDKNLFETVNSEPILQETNRLGETLNFKLNQLKVQ